MRTRKILTAAACLLAAFMLTSSFKPEVTATKTIKMNTIANARLSVGIQSILDVAEEHDFHEEIEEVLYERYADVVIDQNGKRIESTAREIRDILANKW